jgi:hypothetical protein
MNKTGSVGEARFARKYRTSDLPEIESSGIRKLQSSELPKRGSSEVQEFGLGGHR